MSLQYGGECSCEDTASCLCSMEVSAPWSVSHACSLASHSCGGTWRNAADFNTDVHHHGRDTVDTHWSLHDREYALEPLTVHLVKLANHGLSCTDMVGRYKLRDKSDSSACERPCLCVCKCVCVCVCVCVCMLCVGVCLRMFA